MAIGNKRGWMRILEATVSILIISSVLVIIYSNQIDRGNPSEYIFVLQREVLSSLSSNSEYRTAILDYDNDPDRFNTLVGSYVSTKIPGGLGHRMRVCNLSEPCKFQGALTDDIVDAIRSKELYVEEVIIAADVRAGLYSPKKVKLFVWEGEDLQGAGANVPSWSLFGATSCAISTGAASQKYEFSPESGTFSLKFEVTADHSTSNPDGSIVLSSGDVSSINDVPLHINFANNNLVYISDGGVKTNLFSYSDATPYSFELLVVLSSNPKTYTLKKDGSVLGTYDLNPSFTGGSFDTFSIVGAEAGNIKVCNPDGFSEPLGP